MIILTFLSSLEHGFSSAFVSSFQTLRPMNKYQLFLAKPPDSEFLQQVLGKFSSMLWPHTDHTHFPGFFPRPGFLCIIESNRLWASYTVFSKSSKGCAPSHCRTSSWCMLCSKLTATHCSDQSSTVSYLGKPALTLNKSNTPFHTLSGHHVPSLVSITILHLFLWVLI